MRIPGRLHIYWDNDNTLRVDTDSGTQTRLLHFGIASAQSAVPQWQGYSVASWEGLRPPVSRTSLTQDDPQASAPEGYLKVMTTRMKPGYLRKNGVPYGANASLEEYFDSFKELNGDVWLVVTSIVTDPEYLTQPFITSTHFKRLPVRFWLGSHAVPGQRTSLSASPPGADMPKRVATDFTSQHQDSEPENRGNNTLTRREFAALSAKGSAGALLANPLYGAVERLTGTGTRAGREESSGHAALDLAEWSYFWVGVERAELARGTVANGTQMYVEYMIPAAVKHPYPVVLVHGGGGQGTDWMGTPDGRAGWATFLVQEGYAVYIVDRPGHGRPPFHPDLHGPFPAQAPALEGFSGRFTPPNPTSANKPLPFQHLHNQWPGTGEVGSPDLDQFVASQGGSYVSPPGATAAAAQAIAHPVWRERGAMLLDKIGPAIIVTHSAGGPFGWLVAEARPNLVKGIIAIEGGGQPFAGANIWGMSTIPVTYDPPFSIPLS